MVAFFLIWYIVHFHNHRPSTIRHPSYFDIRILNYQNYQEIYGANVSGIDIDFWYLHFYSRNSLVVYSLWIGIQISNIQNQKTISYRQMMIDLWFLPTILTDHRQRYDWVWMHFGSIHFHFWYIWILIFLQLVPIHPDKIIQVSVWLDDIHGYDWYPKILGTPNYSNF